LIILGRGDKKEELKNLARNLNIDEYVTFLGFQSNPYGLVARSNLFVLSSLWEGFPNALIEAMACRIPVISTDCSSGPKEIITSGVNGLLVPVGDVDILADAILKVLTDKELSNKIAKNGRKRVMDFEAKKVVREYEKLFISTMHKNKI
jgi:glycosyltransferase involved in cell wall biosynthesis